MTDSFNFSRSYTYKEQSARSLTWGHHFLLLNILLSIFVGTAYVYAAPVTDGFLAFAYLILTLCGHMAFICCVLYLLILFPLSFIGNFRAYRVLAVILAVLFFTILLVDVKLYLYVKVHLGLNVLRLIFTQLDFNTGLNYNFLFIAVPIVLIFELCFAKIAAAYLYSYKGRKLIYIRGIIAVLTACFVSSHCIHIWADAVNYQQVTMLRTAFPAHYPMTAKSFLESHGWIADEASGPHADFALTFPLEPIEQAEQPNFRNVITVFINGVSQQDINAADTPVLYALKGQAYSYENHYLPYTSIEDNLFAASYGLPRLYRSSVSENRVLPPVLTEMFRQDYLIRVLESRSAQLKLRTAESGSTGLNSLRIEDLLTNQSVILKAREILTHAQGSQHFALTLMLNDLLEAKSSASYAAHLQNTDRALGQLMQTLVDTGRRQDTVIIVTALAGRPEAEPNAALHYDRSRQHVPLILCTPGAGAQNISVLSSLYDLAPTIGAQALGIVSPPSIYSVGYDLTSLPDRDFIVSDSNDITLIGRTQTAVYLSDGQAVIERASGSSAVRPNLADLISAMRELNRFQE